MTENDHYFTTSPESPNKPRTVTVKLRDMELELASDSGVFSSQKLDKGTSVLLNVTTATPPPGPLLDLGCGYGPIAIALAKRFPDREIWAIDVNDRALELTKENAEQLGLTNIVVKRPEDVPAETLFAGIFSNPPIKIGKAALHAMLVRWLDTLQPDGFAFLVVQKHLGSDSLAKWLNEQSYDTKRISSSSGYRVLRVDQKSS